MLGAPFGLIAISVLRFVSFERNELGALSRQALCDSRLILCLCGCPYHDVTIWGLTKVLTLMLTLTNIGY